ncbi:Phosphoribosylglycinamide formyltransferase [Corynebacterium caspium DSM 44850]|nr:Phosphoribosylglycinamide formyltransferase [Corynebacterium caspium DSM 44850]
MVLVSGTGTLLQSILDHRDGAYEVCAVVADTDCPALARAEKAGVPAHVVQFGNPNAPADGQAPPGQAPPGQAPLDRAQWNHNLAKQVAAYDPDIVVSAGFMKILGKNFLDAFPGRIINTHPALLPAFPGAHAVRDALSYGVKITGSTVHFIDEGVDTGKIIAQRPVEVLPTDDEPALHERIKRVERELIVAVLNGAQRTSSGEVHFIL